MTINSDSEKTTPSSETSALLQEAVRNITIGVHVQTLRPCLDTCETHSRQFTLGIPAAHRTKQQMHETPAVYTCGAFGTAAVLVPSSQQNQRDLK